MTSKQIDGTHYQLSLSFDVPRGDFIYQDYLSISTDSPNITLSTGEVSIQPVARYDPASKQTKKMYHQPFVVTVTAQLNQPTVLDAHLYVTCYQHSRKKITPHIFPLIFEHEQPIISMIDTQPIEKTLPHYSNTPNPTLWQTYLDIGEYIHTAWTLFIVLFSLLLNATALFMYPLFILWYPSLYDALFLPLHTINWVLVMMFFCFGIFNLQAEKNKNRQTIGMCTIVLAVLFAAQAYKMGYIPVVKTSPGTQDERAQGERGR
ncbi:MAG: hypothetical protein Q8Q25_00655 [bacterium]|nr:hypothetical protein [bacterium]